MPPKKIVKKCSFHGCERDARVWLRQPFSLCAAHYAQHKRGSTLHPIANKTILLSDNGDVLYTEKECPAIGSNCHISPGMPTRKGYHFVTANGQQIATHRYVWERENGPIPAGMVIDHKCRNRACCNVKHLRIVTPRVNSIENSIGPTAINSAKEFCKNGHPLAGTNLISFSGKDGKKRRCRKCTLEASRQRRRKLRGNAINARETHGKHEAIGTEAD